MRRALPLIIFLISAATLAFEIQLLRLLSIQHWHQFASMIISLALLGFAGSGVVLSLVGTLTRVRRVQILLNAARLLAFSMPFCTWIAQRAPFNSLELLWQPDQLLWLGLIFLTLSLPFFLSGVCVVIAFQLLPKQLGRIYAADLLGAALGASVSALALTLLSPGVAIACCALIAVAATLAPWLKKSRSGIAVSLSVLLLALLLAWLDWPALKLSEFKGQSAALQAHGARLEHQIYSRSAYLAVVANDQIPLRYAPGMSLSRGREPPPQVAVFHDGDRMMAISAAGDDTFLRESVMAAPYAVLHRPTVLVLGAATGNEVRRALVHQATSVVAVEQNAELVSLVRDRYGLFTGGLYSQPQVQIVIESPRHYLAAAERQFDLVVLGSDQSLAAAAAGVGSAKSDYGLTSEAMAAALDRVRPAGLITFSSWIDLPPRRSLKLLGALREALVLVGAADPLQHLLVMRSWGVVMVLASPAPLSETAISKWIRFAESRGFDLACYRGITPEVPNRFNRWRRADLYQACLALFGPDHEAFARSYDFNISSPTDQRPYVGHTFRFSLLPRLWGRQTGADRVLLDSGYLVQLGTTLLAALAGGFLLLMPVLVGPSHRQGLIPVASYFALIGIGFMSYEIYWIEKLSLWFGQPLQAFAMAVALILVGAGLGSALSAALARRVGSIPSLLAGALVLMIIILLFTLLLVNQYETSILAATLGVRMAIAAALIVPLALCLGLFLPLGLVLLTQLRPGLLPWAWAFNGAASVVTAAAAMLLVLDFGQNILPVATAASYCLAMIAIRFRYRGH